MKSMGWKSRKRTVSSSLRNAHCSVSPISPSSILARRTAADAAVRRPSRWLPRPGSRAADAQIAGHDLDDVLHFSGARLLASSRRTTSAFFALPAQRGNSLQTPRLLRSARHPCAGCARATSLRPMSPEIAVLAINAAHRFAESWPARRRQPGETASLRQPRARVHPTAEMARPVRKIAARVASSMGSVCKRLLTSRIFSVFLVVAATASQV